MLPVTHPKSIVDRISLKVFKKSVKSVQATKHGSRNQKMQNATGARTKTSAAALGWTVESLVARSDVVRLIVERLHGYSDPVAKNSVSQKLGRATRSGELTTVGVHTYKVGDLGLYLRRTWSGKFNDIPAFNAPMVSKVGNKKGSTSKGDLSAVTLPADLEAAHGEIHRLNGLLSVARKQIARHHQELSALRPDAEKYRKLIVEKNRTNALKKRPRS